MLEYTDPGALEKALNGEAFVELSFSTLRSFEFALTTSDNPFDVFTNFRSWWNFDHQKNYKTSEILAATSQVTDALGEAYEKKLLVDKMQDIVRVNASGMHKIAVRAVDHHI